MKFHAACINLGNVAKHSTLVTPSTDLFWTYSKHVIQLVSQGSWDVAGHTSTLSMCSGHLDHTGAAAAKTIVAFIVSAKGFNSSKDDFNELDRGEAVAHEHPDAKKRVVDFTSRYLALCSDFQSVKQLSETHGFGEFYNKIAETKETMKPKLDAVAKSLGETWTGTFMKQLEAQEAICKGGIAGEAWFAGLKKRNLKDVVAHGNKVFFNGTLNVDTIMQGATALEQEHSIARLSLPHRLHFI